MRADVHGFFANKDDLESQDEAAQKSFLGYATKNRFKMSNTALNANFLNSRGEFSRQLVMSTVQEIRAFPPHGNCAVTCRKC